jgi:hypothetical protein
MTFWISASQVAGITGVSCQRPATPGVLKNTKCQYGKQESAPPRAGLEPQAEGKSGIKDPNTSGNFSHGVSL